MLSYLFAYHKKAVTVVEPETTEITHGLENAFGSWAMLMSALLKAELQRSLAVDAPHWSWVSRGPV